MTTPLTAARRVADRQSRAIADAAGSGQIVTTVTTVTAGAAADGNARVTVTWRGKEITVSGYAASYTPVAGHRVVCDRIDDRLFIAYRIIGYP